jgi:hypothetical protein
MKIAISLAIICLILIGVFGFDEFQQGKLLRQQIAEYTRQNTQLLTQIEDNSLQRIEAGKTLESLHKALNSRDSQVAALERQLEITRQQIDPDYQQIENTIRQQVRREQQVQASNLRFDPRINLIRQLSELDPTARGELFALQGQYGDFLQSLDVTDERMDVIINALSNMLAEQNQARMQLLEDMQANPQQTNRRDLRQQMAAVSNPEAQLERLAYDLSESELDTFATFQSQRQNSILSINSADTSSYNPFFFGGSGIQRGSAQSTAIQILPANPVEQ